MLRTVWLVAWSNSDPLCHPWGCLSVPITGWLQDSAVAVSCRLQEKLHFYTVETLLPLLSLTFQLPAS